MIAYIERKQKMFNYLSQVDRSRRIQSLICRDNVLKVYGSLFVLYRFLDRSSNETNKPKIGLIQFWLVVNDDEKHDVKALDRIKRLLNSDLSSLLGKTVVSKVEVMTRRNFIARFPGESSTS